MTGRPRGKHRQMRVVVQRVRKASVTVDGAVTGAIGTGLLALVAIEPGDGDDELAWMARRVAGLRIFSDEAGRFGRSLVDVGGALLSVSQFTLVGDARRGMRPSFSGAAAPDEAQAAWLRFNGLVAVEGVPVETGRFGASMQVALVGDGPVTLVLDRRPATRGTPRHRAE